MITHLPADFELWFPYKELAIRLGSPGAAFVFNRVWSDLAFQTRVHGQAGIYKKEYLSHLENSVKEVPDAMRALLNSGFCKERRNGDWWCPIFSCYNYHLDHSYVPADPAWLQAWTDWFNDMMEVGRTLHRRVRPLAWYLPENGAAVSEKLMNRALVLCNILDRILTRKARKPDDIAVPTVQNALRVCIKHSDAKLAVITKRFMAVSRPHLNPTLPNTTEYALEHFDDLIVLLLPNDGFEAWHNRIENMKLVDDHIEDPNTIANDISNELGEHYKQQRAEHKQQQQESESEPDRVPAT